MPRKRKSERDRDTDADDMLLRALRQLADEALVEEVPERLLRPLRDAQRRQQGDGQTPQGVDAPHGPKSESGSSDRGKGPPRRAGSS